MNRFFLLPALLAPLAAQDVSIRHVPAKIDAAFAERTSLCRNAPSEGGAARANDDRQSVSQLLGSVASIDVHQFGSKFSNADSVSAYLRRLMAQKPQTSYGSVPWAEATPLTSLGVVGRMLYTDGSTGAFEAADVHLCAQDSSGVYWWFRLAPLDLLPDRPERVDED
jgi:hypothetical protein